MVAILYDCTIRRLASVYKPRFRRYIVTSENLQSFFAGKHLVRKWDENAEVRRM